MRLVSYDAGAGARAGLLRDDRVHDVRGEARTVDALLRDGAAGRGRARRRTRGSRSTTSRLLPPVGRPGKIICIGLNYRSHCEEQGIEPPETPTFFAKFANALARARGHAWRCRRGAARWTTRPRWRS